MSILKLLINLLFIKLTFSETLVLFDSDIGDYIGLGVNVTFISNITVQNIRNNEININIRPNTTWFDLSFVMPNNVKNFSVGNYGNAERTPFRSPLRPGIEISGDGRGCNKIKGWFRVLEADFSEGNNRIAINFKQNCEEGSKALYGVVRINSTIPVNIYSPVAIAGSNLEVIEGETVTLNGEQSFIRDNTSLYYLWSQLSGPPVEIRNATAVKASFIAPKGIRLGGEVLEFRLLVVSENDDYSKDKINVKVHSKSDAQNYIEFLSDSGDYIGGGRRYHFDKSDTSISLGGNSKSGVSFSLTNSDWWSIDMAPPSGSRFNLGEYTDAERYPFQSSDRPGLSVSGAGRGCNTLKGSFNVTQLIAASTGQIVRFGATFEQHCEGSTPALRGTIRYNYIDPRVPQAVAGPLQYVTSGQTVVLDGSGSSQPDLSFHWSQISGRNVTLDNTTVSKPKFVAPLVSSDENLVFQLLVTNNEGFSSSAITSVIVNPEFV